MAVIQLPSAQRFLSQPQYQAPFASEHTPAACFLASSSVELVGRQFRTESNLIDSVSSQGRARAAVSRYYSDSYPVNVPSLTDFTLYLYASYVDCLDAYQYLMGFSKVSDGNYLGIPSAHNNISGNWGLFASAASVTTFLDSGEKLPQNKLTAIVITRAGSTVKLFRDGVLKNSATYSTVIPALTNLTLNSAEPAGGFGSHTDSYYVLAGLEPIAWVDEKVRRFCDNPFALFRAPSRLLSVSTTASTPVGTINFSEEDDVVAGSGTTTVKGIIAIVEDTDIVNASGAAGSDVNGSLSFTEADDTVSASGTTIVKGTINFTEADDVVAGSGTAISPVTGIISFIEEDDVVAALGFVPSSGTILFTEEDDVVFILAVVTPGWTIDEPLAGSWSLNSSAAGTWTKDTPLL